MRLYNKYRPTTFSGVLGNESEKLLLKKVVKEEVYKVRKEYLLESDVGGVGKTTLAMIFAKAINCTNNVDGDPCGECDSCVAFDGGVYPDYISLNGAEYNQLDKIKPIIDLSKQVPIVKDGTRVFVIDEAHRMSPQALSEFLDVFEFGTQKFVFIFTTTNLASLPQPLVSRTANITIVSPTKDEIYRYMKQIADGEGIQYSGESLKLFIDDKYRSGSVRGLVVEFENYIFMHSKLTEYKRENEYLSDFTILLAKAVNNGVSTVETAFYKYDDSIIEDVPKILFKLISPSSEHTYLPEDVLKLVTPILSPTLLVKIAKDFLKYSPKNIREFILFMSFFEESENVAQIAKTTLEETIQNTDNSERMLLSYGFVKEKNHEDV